MTPLAGQSADHSNGSPASQFASALLAALIAEGLTDVVVSPGARSQALALAAAQLEARGELSLHVRIDERSAAFFALGIAKETRRPAAVITTSGTAVANLLPAVLEAHHAGVPMLLLTADRPHELRGIRSNQTTIQPGIFGNFARFETDEVAPEPGEEYAMRATQLADDAWQAATRVEHPGPVHLNLAFRIPLSDGGVNWDALHAEITQIRGDRVSARDDSGRSGEPDHSPAERFTLNDGKRTVVVAGMGAGPEAEEFAHAAQLPLLAEVVSGARFGREAITHYRALLNSGLGTQIERVVVFGVPTLSREVPALVRRDGVQSVVVTRSEGEVFNPGRAVERVVKHAVVGESYDPLQAREWLGQWIVADRELIAQHTSVHEPDLEAARETGYKERSDFAKRELEAMREPITRAMLAESVWRATWPHDRLVVGASKLIRVLDTLAQPRNVTVHSNRGLAGIDGTISTAGGVAVASQPEGDLGVTRVLLGDITALHDVGGLFWGAGEGHPRLLLIVGNDGGGTIFDALEVAETAQPDEFERVLYTPQQVSFEHLAAAYGWSYQTVDTRAELERTLTAPVAGLTLLEVTLAR